MASVTGDVKCEMGIGNGGLRIETIRKRDSIWRKNEPKHLLDFNMFSGRPLLGTTAEWLDD